MQGLDPTDLAGLKKALDAWNAAYPAHIAAQNKAEAARQSKDAAKRELERQIRPVSAFVQSYPKTTDADRAELGITVKDTTATPTPVPASRPLLLIDAASRLTHRLRLVDESTPTRSARPVTRGGAEVTFLAEQGGLSAAYLDRWVSATGEPGPWGESVTAAVAA